MLYWRNTDTLHGNTSGDVSGDVSGAGKPLPRQDIRQLTGGGNMTVGVAIMVT
jgi:hypothetical protein